VISLVLVISALAATSALACVPLVGVNAPNPNSHANGNPPPRTTKVCPLPDNQGIFPTAYQASPAIDNCLQD
jgi:hypothetical protein